MADKHILRTPDLSESRIMLKAGKDPVGRSGFAEGNDEIVSAAEHGKVFSEQDFSAKYSEYVSKLEDLARENEKLDQLTRDMEQDREQLESEKQNYRQQVEEQVRNELEEKYRQEYAERNEELLVLIDAVAECKIGEVCRFEDELVALAYEAVCKIIGQAMADKSVAVSVVREVISHAQDRMQMILRVAPHDFDIIQEAKELLSRGLTNRLEVVADDHVGYGGCILETDAGTIDGRLEQQLNSLLELLVSERAATSVVSG